MSKEYDDSMLEQAGLDPIQRGNLRQLRTNIGQRQAEEFLFGNERNWLEFTAWRLGMRQPSLEITHEEEGEGTVSPEKAKYYMRMIDGFRQFISTSIVRDPRVDISTMVVTEDKWVTIHRASHRNGTGTLTFQSINGGALDGTVEVTYEPDDIKDKEERASVKVTADGDVTLKPAKSDFDKDTYAIDQQNASQTSFPVFKRACDLLLPYMDLCARTE